MRRRIERNRARWSAWLTVASLSVAYLAMTSTLISCRALWNDELFTYYIAVRPTFRDVWHTLLTGAEQLPPFFYAVMRSGIAIFGLSEVSLRISEMFGVGVAALSVYWFSARRTSTVCAMAGAIFLLCTAAYEYVYEARPYGLVLGFSGLALVAWQRATENSERRGIALGGLALMLTAAVHTHYYAPLVLGPLRASEFTLDWMIGDRPRASVLATLLLGTCFVANFVHEKNSSREAVRITCEMSAGFWKLRIRNCQSLSRHLTLSLSFRTTHRPG